MVTFPLRVKPGAARTKVGGVYAGPYGDALVVCVHARPEHGRATDEALSAVADALGLRRRDLVVRAGHASRDKLVAITDPPIDLSERLAALRGPALGG
jgi:uncharacterized protein YggU (UPF0235/DUF167 family)